MPLGWSVDDMVRLLDAGINVISTANFITGHSYGDEDMRRLHQAAEGSGASLYGTGISPVHVSTLALTLAGATDRKRGVEGKGVSERVVIRCSRRTTKKH